MIPFGLSSDEYLWFVEIELKYHMTEVRCRPVLPEMGLDNLQLASLVAPEAVRTGYSNQNGQGMLQPVCIGVDGTCPLMAALEELRGIGEIPAHNALPDRFKGCVYAHSQP